MRNAVGDSAKLPDVAIDRTGGKTMRTAAVAKTRRAETSAGEDVDPSTPIPTMTTQETDNVDGGSIQQRRRSSERRRTGGVSCQETLEVLTQPILLGRIRSDEYVLIQLS